MTPTDTIIALEKALEAGPTPGVWECQDESKFLPDEPYWIGAQHPLGGFVSHAVVRSGCTEADELGDMKANAAFIAAANPLAIRTLLDAHASALQALEWIVGNPGAHPANFVSVARAALDDNTKGAAE